MWGIHDNPVNGSHPSGTVKLTSQRKHQYLPHTCQDKRKGRARNKDRVWTSQQQLMNANDLTSDADAVSHVGLLHKIPWPPQSKTLRDTAGQH